MDNSTTMQPSSKHPNLIVREGIWYLFRRVPKKFTHIEPRKHIAWSTRSPAWADPRAVRA